MVAIERIYDEEKEQKNKLKFTSYLETDPEYKTQNSGKVLALARICDAVEDQFYQRKP